MKQQPIILNALEASLEGNILIEASAGTGKTYTITSLVLRFLLGLTEKERPLKLEELLIVTFTNAATAELKERIFKRIVESKECLISQEFDAFDETLVALLEPFLFDESARREAILRLIEAERTIDQAAIFTIHGFCQRILSQSALATGLEFEFELNSELNDLLEESCRIVWRKDFYRFNPELVACVLDYFGEPVANRMDALPFAKSKSLLGTVRPYIQNPKLFEDEPNLITSFEALDAGLREYQMKMATLKENWKTFGEEAVAIIQTSDINKRSYSAKHLPNWANKVLDFCQEAGFNYPDELSRFSQKVLYEKTKTGGMPPEHPLFNLVDQFLEFAHAFNLEKRLKLYAAYRVYNEFEALKHDAGELNFDDILIKLDGVLAKRPERLLAHVREQYQAVMIDEFQDTDYYQLSIFQTLFGEANQIPFIMIGDPKQSIYKFRGADIYAYLSAKKGVDLHYTLDTNYRSSSKMIEGVNHFFKGSANPFLEENIPFYPVKYPEKALAEHLYLKGDEEMGMRFFNLSAEVNREEYTEFYANFFADDVVELLYHGEIETNGARRKIIPADITFLVRSAHEARVLKEALFKRNLNAVYLSDRSNVFHSEMADELALFLESLLYFRDFSLTKRSFASLLYGLSLDEYFEVMSDPERYEAMLEERYELKELWDRIGVLGMVRHFMMRGDRLARLRVLPDGERLITDLFHLAELLQAQKMATDELLLAWFKEERERGETEEVYHQRLESDFEAIKILTYHKSKGLEFPIVYLPFAVSPVSYRDPVSYYDKEKERIRYSFTPSETIKEQILDEEFAEAVRLLYVAMTRSKFHCRVGFASHLMSRRSSVTHQSAIGSILGLTEVNATLPETLIKPGIIDITEVPEHILDRVFEEKTAEPELSAARMNRYIPNIWRFTSFSHLSYKAEVTHFQDERFDEMPIQEEKNPDQTEIQTPLPKAQLHFPKGTVAGTFLHDLLENYSPRELGDEAILSEAIKRSPLYLSLADELDSATLDLKDWFAGILQTPLNQDDEMMTLGTILSNDQHTNELEFLFPIRRDITPEPINQFLMENRTRTLPAKLTFKALTGMLKGFIDLTFIWQGKYYICDYKSNFLGESCEDYQQESMQTAMDEAYYDWQYLLYTVALVKFLRLKNPEFNYETDFGGIYYLFLRGMRGDASGDGIYHHKPAWSVIEKIMDYFDAK